jgi:hypothetical protein
MRVRSAVRILLLLSPGLAPIWISAQGQLTLTPGEVGYQFPTEGRMRWTSSLLVGCDYCASANPIVWATNITGNRESISLSISGSDRITVRDVATAPDGSLAAVGLAIGSSRMGTFIAWISPDRSEQTITRVSPYAPNVVTVALDGTIWTIGSDDSRKGNDNVLRHYTSSGQLLASKVVQGVRPMPNGFPQVSNPSSLLASSDRIGWLTSSCQYIEFSFDAVELGRYSCPNGYGGWLDVAGIALSPTDDVLVGGQRVAPLAPFQLNRASGAWTPVAVSGDSGTTNSILGFDGPTLMTSSTSPVRLRRYVWSRPTTTGGQ